MDNQSATTKPVKSERKRNGVFGDINKLKELAGQPGVKADNNDHHSDDSQD